MRVPQLFPSVTVTGKVPLASGTLTSVGGVLHREQWGLINSSPGTVTLIFFFSDIVIVGGIFRLS